MDSFINNFENYGMGNQLDYPIYPNDYKENNKTYMSDYLRKHIGKMVKLEIYIGTCLEKRIGQLIEVEDNFVVLRMYRPSTTTICDISDIKFITISHANEIKNLV